MRRPLIKLIVIIVFFAGVAGASYYFLWLSHVNQNKTINAPPDQSFGWKFPVAKFPEVGSTESHLAYSDIRDPGGIPQGLPVRLQIPIIGVDSAIEDALITPDGRMDVPAGSVNVAWFALGPHPGQVGSAVIGGHFGINNNVPFVFYNLDKLKVGDKVYIVNDKSDTLAFVVRSIKSFDRNADATTVFTSNDGLAHLNLITCEGMWNQVNGTYPLRLVIFTDAIAIATGTTANGMVPAFGRSLGSEANYNFTHSLGIGSQGAEVASLQIILEQKGFLTLPQRVNGGYFGPLTRTAVAKYQASVGLPSVGAFGPLTRAQLIREMTPQPQIASSTFPATGMTIPESTSFLQALVQFAKSLYATLLDGLITSLLLILIVLMIFKIIRRWKTNS